MNMCLRCEVAFIVRTCPVCSAQGDIEAMQNEISNLQNDNDALIAEIQALQEAQDESKKG